MLLFLFPDVPTEPELILGMDEDINSFVRFESKLVHGLLPVNFVR